jgi:putative ATPase
MRPRTLDEVVGQVKALAPGSPLSMLAKRPEGSTQAMTSVVIWGPPGTGKTTIAKAVANTSGRRFVELSAVSTGVKELREVIDKARNEAHVTSINKVLWINDTQLLTASDDKQIIHWSVELA